MELLGLLGSVAFALASAVVGVRLLWLARRTRGAPELAMGLAFVSSGAIGFAFYVASDLLAKGGSPEELTRRCAASGMLFFFLGYLGLAFGNWRMFRPSERWPLAPIALCAALLAVAATVVLRAPTLAAGSRGELTSWLGIAVGACVFAWSALEAYRLHRQMQRRLRVGLVEPGVVDRVRLWGIGSCAAFAMTAHAIALRFVTGTPAMPADQRLASSFFGLVAAVAIWLAFFPPASYRRRFARVSSQLR